MAIAYLHQEGLNNNILNLTLNEPDGIKERGKNRIDEKIRELKIKEETFFRLLNISATDTSSKLKVLQERLDACYDA